MSGIRPGALLLICACLVAVAVPVGISLWESTGRFIGGVTMIGSSDGQPREIGRAGLFVLAGVISALVYLVLAGMALLLVRRYGRGVQNVALLIIVPLALALVWLRVTR